MGWQVRREDIEYYIYDERANTVGYFIPEYGTNEEDRIIDLITDEASVRGGTVSLYLSDLPKDSMHYDRFLEWLNSVNDRLKRIKEYSASKGLSEPYIKFEHSMIVVTFDIRFDRRVELTKKSLSDALNGILNELKYTKVL